MTNLFLSTHYAGFQGAIAARNILLPLSDGGVIENVPSVTFTSPEVSLPFRHCIATAQTFNELTTSIWLPGIIHWNDGITGQGEVWRGCSWRSIEAHD